MSFEEQMTQLEQVVEKLERGELTLEQSVQLFEDGMRLSELCRKELDAAEGRVQVLVERRGGKMETQDLAIEGEPGL